MTVILGHAAAPRVSPALHHLGHYPAPSLALISLCLQGKMGLLWIAFVSPGLNSWPIFSIFFFFFSSEINLMSDLVTWS